MKSKVEYAVDSVELTNILSSLLIDIRNGDVSISVAKSISTIADKINRNNLNDVLYKKVSGHNKEIKFFEHE